MTGDMDERVIPDVIPDVLLPQGRYPENEEWGFLYVGTWRTFKVPDWRLGPQGHL